MNQAVPNKTALLALLQANGERIRGYGIRVMGVFGSFKRDEGIHAESDVDFIIEFEEGQHTFRNKMDLYRFLKDLLGRDVELIPPAALNPSSGPRILKETEYVTLGRGQDTGYPEGISSPAQLHKKSYKRRPS